MISVDEALAHLFSLITPLDSEVVPLGLASGRVLAADAIATRDQPPFAASAMDGYGVLSQGAAPGAQYDVIGEAAAGHGFDGAVGPGQAVRIFTGAPVPAGVDRVIIQEDITRHKDRITVMDSLAGGPHIRPLGADFKVGDTFGAPRVLSPSDVALLAAMNIAQVTVRRKPDIALISTGDELVMPGEAPGPDQIIASNTFGLKALLEAHGARARILPIARDTRTSLEAAFELARNADLVVTIGGASVGDHDLVGDVAADLGVKRAFYKVKMRPGKPLMAGQFGDAAMVGLPGNPVSAMVCGHVFLRPMLRAMLGFEAVRSSRRTARLAIDIGANGPREHYMRAQVTHGEITPEPRQDSALLSVLADANALMIRPPDDAARKAGDMIDYLAM
ncbi:MAG: molybdopterin molybdotransferase MoeA [Roseovarius sp.]|nr:molybdopterin molybdotransferase MoeA [Roseovarius sp.]